MSYSGAVFRIGKNSKEDIGMLPLTRTVNLNIKIKISSKRREKLGWKGSGIEVILFGIHFVLYVGLGKHIMFKIILITILGSKS